MILIKSLRLTYEQLKRTSAWVHDPFQEIMLFGITDICNKLEYTFDDLEYEILDLKYCFCVRLWAGEILLREHYTHSPVVTCYFETMERKVPDKIKDNLLQGILQILYGLGTKPAEEVKEQSLVFNTLKQQITAEIDQQIINEIMKIAGMK